jgi:hypothetical protein
MGTLQYGTGRHRKPESAVSNQYDDAHRLIDVNSMTEIGALGSEYSSYGFAGEITILTGLVYLRARDTILDSWFYHR